jgi:hypothetical protein
MTRYGGWVSVSRRGKLYDRWTNRERSLGPALAMATSAIPACGLKPANDVNPRVPPEWNNRS